MNYQEFLDRKAIIDLPTGFDCGEITTALFDWQKDIVRWACRRGRAAMFEGCGLGKTAQQLEWAKQVCNHTGGSVLILAPLAVSKQTKKEGEKFGISVNIAASQDDIIPGINITNYEKLHKFDPSSFAGVVADESGIMKSYTGKVKKQLCEMFERTAYRLSCTATPSPNDYEELGNQAEWLGVCSRSEMLAMFFINDTQDTGTWRLKKHAEKEFWKWVCSWAVMIQKPSDLGYDDRGFILPGLEYIAHVIEEDGPQNGYLFAVEAKTLSERRQARRNSMSKKVEIASGLVNNSEENWIIWCDLNDESKTLAEAIDGAVEVTGSDSDQHKETAMLTFADNQIKALVSKPKIAGWGMNWQNCHNIIFVGLSDSFEAFYQAVRRCYRFGQKNKVKVHVITHRTEGAVVRNIQRKERAFESMSTNMTMNMADITRKEINSAMNEKPAYRIGYESGENWELYNEDCVDVVGRLPDDSVHYMIYSPPFASLFTYSNSDRDMGNCRDHGNFLEHFKFLAKDLHRVLIPGRLMSFHVMNLSATITRDGYIGMKDLRGDLIRLFQAVGFIYHSEVCIWKDPLVQATRTKVLTLAHKQISKDATRCAQGFPDYIVTMRKDGINPEPVSKGRGFEEYIGEMPAPKDPKKNNARENKFSHHVWQRYASPVWFDIRQTRTLNEKQARDKDDERHMCPLQLDTIERCLDLWTNPGDLVLSPFAGIGSEGYSAVNMGRRFIGAELKKSYFDVAVRNLQEASAPKKQMDLFSMVEAK
jgi:DNA modification methylase